MSAYIVVEPTNPKPNFFRCLLRASDSELVARHSKEEAGEVLFVLVGAKLQTMSLMLSPCF